MVKGKGKQICMILALIGLLTGCGSQSKVPDAEYEMFNNKFELKNAPGYRARLEK